LGQRLLAENLLLDLPESIGAFSFTCAVFASRRFSAKFAQPRYKKVLVDDLEI
jgi:hypothetical protein